MIIVSKEAPPYLADACRQADLDIAYARLGPFVSFAVYPAAGDLPDPAKNANKMIFLSGGTFWLAKSDGTDWLYPDNTAV